MGRLLHIGFLAFLGLSFILVTFFLYYSYKKIRLNGKSLMEQAVNDNMRTEKLSLEEVIIYSLMFIIAFIFAIQLVYKGENFPSGTAVLIRTIILVPIMALFNARKRTGKSVLALIASLLFLLFCVMTYMIIGLPVKAPVIVLNDTEIILGKTTVGELIDQGYDFYLEKGQVATMDIFEFPHSEEFEKYTKDMSVLISEGYHYQSTVIVPHSHGYIAKNDAFIAEVIFYGSMSEKTELKDCSIIHWSMQDRYISRAKSEGLSLKLSGVELIGEIEPDTMKKFFGGNIIRPNQIEADKHCIISWHSRSEHLFFNSYAAVISMDDDYMMDDIEFECQIAREAD